MKEPIAVLAGTPVDTRMGVDCLRDHGLEGMFLPVSPSPQEQMFFQISSREEKNQEILRILRGAMDQGCKKAFIYCNSLSGAVDFTPLAEQTGMHIVTPLHAYARLASQHQSLAVVAANAQGLSGIERTLLHANHDLKLMCASGMGLVLSIEAEMDPDALVQHHHLDQLASWFQNCGMDALILGCTHFPYFKEALSRRTTLPLIDPADEMVRLLNE